MLIDHTMKELSELEKNIGITFQNKDILQTAMVHRSYLNEHHNFRLDHNERLEFLGDAVLELIVTQYLYDTYDNPEGELTNWRASLVNAQMLGEVAGEIHLNDFIQLSRGEAKDTNPKARMYILANACEALIGAVYLDQGWSGAKDFVERFLISKLPHILEHGLYLDPKSKFQEASQEKVSQTPTYKVIEETGPDHAKEFTVGVYLGEDLIAQGEGTSKQEAQVQAAAKALEKKGWQDYRAR